jgi:ubiquinone/menaquinone biosynthesis C-methylase UbiE
MKERVYTHLYTENYFNDTVEFYNLYHPLCSAIAMILVERLRPRKSLEIGCGLGYFVHALRELDIEAYGVDISEYAINNGVDGIREYLTCRDVDTEQLPYAAESFDLVTSLRAMEHLNKPQNAIEEMERLLKPGGFVVVFVPTSNLWRRLWYSIFEHSRRYHVSVFTKSQWVHLFKSCGFEYKGDILNLASDDLLKAYYAEEMKLHSCLPPSTLIGRLLFNLGKPGKRVRTMITVFMWRGDGMLFQKK